MKQKSLQEAMRLPQKVYVQISRRCNLTCAMCGWKAWARNKGVMPPEIFTRIVEECVANKIGTMRFSSAQGEPMLNPHWGEYADQAIAAGLSLNINTNCTPLSERNIARLRTVAETTRFTIQLSFAGHDKASYEKTYDGSDFDLTSEKLRALWVAIGALRDNSGAPVLTVRGVVYSLEAKEQSIRYLHSLGITPDRVAMVRPDNFTGKVESLKSRVGPKPLCFILTQHIGVYDDGTVTACGSRDSEGEMKLGNIMESGFLELRASPAYKAMIQAFIDQSFEHSPLCRDCDLPYPGTNHS